MPGLTRRSTRARSGFRGGGAACSGLVADSAWGGVREVHREGAGAGTGTAKAGVSIWRLGKSVGEGRERNERVR